MTIIITDRPTAKAIGHTNYERYRRRQIAYGRWQRWTEVEPVRQHILALRRDGMGRDGIARATGVTEHTIRRITNRKVTKVHVDTATRILAIVDPKPPYVNATGARRRLQALGVLGWDQCTLAARIGWDVRNLNLIVSGRRQQIVHDTNERIHRLYEDLSATPAPAGYAASRAKSSARRHSWAPPLAWDDDAIDDPNAQPNLGDPDDQQDGYDPTTVALAVDGRLTYQQLNAHRPDLIETVRRLAKTLSDVEIAHHLRWPGASNGPTGKTSGQNSVGKLRGREGIPTTEKYQTVYAYRPGGKRVRNDKAT